MKKWNRLKKIGMYDKELLSHFRHDLRLNRLGLVCRQVDPELRFFRNKKESYLRSKLTMSVITEMIKTHNAIFSIFFSVLVRFVGFFSLRIVFQHFLHS